MNPPKRKLKVTSAKYNEQGVLVSLKGTYNRFEEVFYDVEKHYE